MEGVRDARTNAVTRASAHTPALALATIRAPTRVVAIYPSAPRVPENLLKIYLEFSAPMRDGEAAARVRLLDARGRTLEGAFLQVDEELWDPSRRRLTLLLDPGRVKRGLRAHRESGAPLQAGLAVTLAIDGGWPDDAGQPLAEPARQRWDVVAADRSSPAPERWRIDQPLAGTRAPLVVHFGEPLDRALLGRLLRVEDASGRLVPGDARVEPAESGWRFTPAAPWSDEAYTLVVDRRLEDLAANRPSALFDVDLTRRAIAPPRHAAGLAAGAAAGAAAETSDAVRLRIRPRRAPAPAL